MSTSLRVDPSTGLFGVGSSGKNDIGVLGTGVSVVTLVDDESVAGNGRGGELVGAEEVDEFGFGFGGGRGRSETNVVSGCSRGGLEDEP